jgi:TldD protein
MVDADALRKLAMVSMEVASRERVAYADVRVANTRRFMTRILSISPIPFSAVDFKYMYGVRVMVNGVWGFAFGTRPTEDEIAKATRQAIVTTREMAKFAGKPLELAPAQPARGEWTTPIAIDPFAVSPDDHAKILGAYLDAIANVLDASTDGFFALNWSKETRVFASTDGSLITQRLAKSEPRIGVRNVPHLRDLTVLPVIDFMPSSVGFESVIGPDVQEHLKEKADEAAQLAGYPSGIVDVGRYPAVLDGTALASIIAGTIAPALEMSRALGYENDGSGSSFLAPPKEIVGQQLFAPSLTIRTTRAAPTYGAAKWDDEGVETEPFVLVHNGRVVEYFTTRSSAPLLSEWYASSGRSNRSRGSAVAWDAASSPVGAATQLSVDCSDSPATLDTLVKNMKNGLLVRGSMEYGLHSDQQLTGGLLAPHMLYEVKNGAITRRLRGSVQFGTKRLLKAISAVGDAGTLQHFVRRTYRGEVWSASAVPVVAPAVQVAQLDALQERGR